MADWLNNDLSDYVDAKEKISIDVRQNIKMCRISSMISALFIALFASFFITIFAYVVTMFVMMDTADDSTFLAVLGLVLGCTAGCVFVCGYPLFAWLMYNSQRSRRYVLTNCGIYKISGLIFKNVKFVAYKQITDVSMRRGPIQRIIGVGSVGVGTASGNVVGSVTNGTGQIYSADELTIDSIDNYKQVKDVIARHRKK